MSRPALRALRLRKCFPLTKAPLWALWLGGRKPIPSFIALDDISVTVPKGEMLGVLGANGAGKSTLLRSLAGVYHPDGGTVERDGTLASLFEMGGFGNLHITGRQYVRRYMEMHNIPKAQCPALIDEIHNFSELGDYFDRKIRTYSAGMATRLYFATATALPKNIYLIDEILSVGDEHFQAKSWARMRDRVARGISGVLVTHDWSAVIKLCRNACILDKGRIVYEGKADDVVASYLRIDVPQSEEARISDVPDIAQHQDKPLRLTFEITLAKPVEAELSLSVEYLMLGIGWEIVVLSEFLPVGSAPGTYRVTMGTPYMPLVPGEYGLNLFLSTKPDPATGQRTPLHAMSWTCGNGLALRVEGAACEGLAPFPITWQQVNA